MRPGLTGPMQVHGRGELSFNERMSVEREYVENYSIRKDVKILLRTVSTISGKLTMVTVSSSLNWRSNSSSRAITIVRC